MTGPSSPISNFSMDMLEVTKVTEDGFHVDFFPLDGDIVLKSSDDVKFRTHSFVLKIASGVFRTTLSLPQVAGACPNEYGHVIALSEDSRTINAILRMISGMEIPPLDNFDDVEKVLLTAKKWDMSGPPSIIHRMITPQALLDDPLRLYALACRVGWNEAAAVAATHTLDVDLQHEDLQPILHSMASGDVLKLLDLRMRRRDALLDFLLSYTVPGCLSHLPHSTPHATEHELSIQWQWKAFMFTVFIAMDRHPSGKTLSGSKSVIQSDLEDMRNIQCPHVPDDIPAFDVEALEEVLQTKIAELPRTI